jgi:hypothetical protein
MALIEVMKMVSVEPNLQIPHSKLTLKTAVPNKTDNNNNNNSNSNNSNNALTFQKKSFPDLGFFA